MLLALPVTKLSLVRSLSELFELQVLGTTGLGASWNSEGDGIFEVGRIGDGVLASEPDFDEN